MLRMLKSLKFTPVLILFCVLFLWGCGPQPALPEPARPPEPLKLRIAATNNLAPALKEVGAQFEKKNNVKINFVLDATESLLQQIDGGDTFDVIAVTDAPFIDKLLATGKIIPETLESYSPPKFSIAALKGAPGEKQARRFIQYMSETEGEMVLQKYGLVRSVKPR